VFLSFNNNLKTTVKWLWSGNMPSKESVERAVLEVQEAKDLEEGTQLTEK
jgi:hypothetical protein